MTARNAVLEYIDRALDCGSFQDYCVNGLQVEGRKEVRRIATGVSASLRFFEEASAWGADLLVVHHGLFWKNSNHPFALTGVTRNRVAFLLNRDINLAAYHLPLDAHPELGNNAVIMRRLEADVLEQVDVGFTGVFEPELPVADLAARVDGMLPSPALRLTYGPEKVRNIAVVSGGAPHLLEEAAGRGVDAFITGELSEYVPRLAEELGVHVFAMGHYNSERFGVMALGERLFEVFDLPVRFFDVANPV